MKHFVALQTGDSMEEVTLEPVTRLDLIKYAGASGDYNPIHTIDEEATKAGLPGIIAHGMWTMGNLAKLFTPYYEEGFIQEYKIRFSGMVFLNDIITLKAVVEDVNEHSLDLKVAAVNQAGKNVIKGTVTFKTY
ncbi:MaoC/PaaZ C-terminal domain-containing protein [Lentibacillus sp. Marseille-P4043]|uniref:MaoC/PaaZ C-terminal domain-containing protein n=1 Tax=Lentibacillus sp. Marseille-P4043 TaxID=2040293 RepID=UPI000D0B0459|nr:MaoC/PaaZ C-terminal domain-containing protein [Lentibacillus sp. Marseille-P4043]